MFRIIIIIVVASFLLPGCSITIRTVCVQEDDVEIISSKETENYNCTFLKELGGSSGRQYYLWRCSDGLKLYY